MNEGANTIHINAKLRMTICDKLNTKTPLKFVETKWNKKLKISIHQLHGKIETMNKTRNVKNLARSNTYSKENIEDFWLLVEKDASPKNLLQYPTIVLSVGLANPGSSLKSL